MRECYFGKSCVGKTTYLKRIGVDAVDCDVLCRNAMEDRYGFKRAVWLRALNRQRFIAYVSLFRNGMVTDSIKEQFVRRAKWTSGKLMDEKFWDIFFEMAEGSHLDFAAFGFYMDIIPKHHIEGMELVELESDCFDTRVRNAEHRGYDKYVLMALDSMYERPKAEFSTIRIKSDCA